MGLITVGKWVSIIRPKWGTIVICLDAREWYVEKSLVLAFPPAAPEDLAYLAAKLSRYADAWDVAEDLRNGVDGVVVIDTRAERCAPGHIPGALSLPHRLMDEAGTAQLDREKCM